MGQLTSSEVPINQYRVIWEMMHTLDRDNTIITHDSGSPREQLLPFWECTKPGSYMGWGKSTQLGYGLGINMGAKLAEPGKICINVMGDSAIGMVGMDLETAVREKIPVLIVLVNNSLLGGYQGHHPVASEKYNLNKQSGDYVKVAQGLGAYSELVNQPAEIVPALQRAKKKVDGGQAALLEIITREELDRSFYR